MIKIKDFIKEHKKDFLFLFVLLLIGAFLRLYKIDEYMTFLGDEGRDALLVRRFLVNGDIMLIGPGTSVGNMYLGPMYYYMIAPALLLANFSPVGPSIFVALMGVATIAFMWFVAKEWFGRAAAFIAAGLYAISPTVIVHSHSSWNPNIMPFFALLSMFFVWRVWRNHEYKWLIWLGVTTAAVLQSHYLGLILLPIMAGFLLLTFFTVAKEERIINQHASIIHFIKFSFIGLFLFLLLMSPLVAFDLRHNYMNFTAFKNFLSADNGSDLTIPFESISKIPQVLELMMARLLGGRNKALGAVVLAEISIPSLLLAVSRKKIFKKELHGYIFTLTWVLAGTLGLSFYRNDIYDHYMGFLFPAPFLLFGGFAQDMFIGLNKIGKAIVMAGIALLIIANISNNPFRYPGPKQLARSVAVADKILLEAKGRKFNLAVLAERNYEDGYLYFLEKAEAEVLHADKWYPETITDQLFVVCEKPEKDCKPTTDPKAEIANFGMSRIDRQWSESGVTIYRLVHNK